MLVYRPYDQETLQDAYQLRAVTETSEAVFELCRQQTAERFDLDQWTLAYRFRSGPEDPNKRSIDFIM